MHKSIRNIAIAGSGNVAWHLAKALCLQGYKITRIWSRKAEHASMVADLCDAEVCHSISDLRQGAELIIIAVPDKAIEEICKNIGVYEGIVVHTAGSVAIDILSSYFNNYGVFYPLQTFSKNKELLLDDVPFFIEGSSIGINEVLKQIALKLSSRVYDADSSQRLLLHVAAVFAGNYSNLMYSIGNEILQKSSIPPEVLHPLMIETTRKAVENDPVVMQTGPARRDDIPTIEKHINALSSLPEYAELYRLLASLISQKYK